MEILHNGIQLPENWPPHYSWEILADEMPVPYLQTPPGVICIDIGRQLFVDDFLIEETDLVRVCHKAKKYEGNPVLFPETAEEKEVRIPCACPKSGGVWWDREEHLYKMWYEAGWLNGLAYAVSSDGIHWERPELDVIPGTNRLLPFEGWKDSGHYHGKNYFRTDSTTVFIDYEDVAERKYKLFLRSPGGDMPGIVMTSGDGIHWENCTETTELGDRSTVFYDPFRKKWVYSIRTICGEGADWKRARKYSECNDFLKGADFSKTAVPWLCTDGKDLPDDLIGWKPQLYNVDAVAYESVMLGMFQIMQGPENHVGRRTGCPKITELQPMFSRDGFHFFRPSRECIIDATRIRGTWDRGYVQSVGGICIVKEDELWIYYTAFSGDPAKTKQTEEDWTLDAMYSGGACGIAKLRRDGFCSMEGEGRLLTRPLIFHEASGLYVNFSGTVKAEILAEDGTLLAASDPLTGDSTKAKLEFQNSDISAWIGKAVRIRFTVSGALYAFWTGKDGNGKSGGYLAAGAPEE